jgi:hypothetical protein
MVWTFLSYSISQNFVEYRPQIINMKAEQKSFSYSALIKPDRIIAGHQSHENAEEKGSGHQGSSQRGETHAENCVKQTIIPSSEVK